jgi:uncharacterized membrane protein YjjP (DUF1212 family)
MDARRDQTAPLLTPPGEQPPLDLVIASANLLFASGQTTERTVEAVTRLGEAIGCRATLFPLWGQLTVRFDCAGGPLYEIIATAPKGVEMHRVTATMDLIDKVCEGQIGTPDARRTLNEIARFSAVSALRFSLLAAAGATALGVIFGSVHPLSLALIALSAGTGAALRRWIAGVTGNPFVQPLLAALLAGVFGAVVARLHLSADLSLVDACPCMLLVPGPHILNGALDLAHSRIALGAARLTHAGLIILMVCTGLLGGLSFGGVALPVFGAPSPVPLGYDILAAGVAVMAYGTFFSMPWRTLPVPALIGMLAHASRWVIVTMGGSIEVGALVACLLVGAIATPVATRLRLPFAALGFASVVSLVPGVFLFRMAGALVALIYGGGRASPGVVLDAIVDGTTAVLIMLAMAFGLIMPKMCIDHFRPGLPAAAPGAKPATGG